MDEGSGVLVEDLIGGNDGSLVGVASWEDGKFGKAIRFDGTSGFVSTLATGAKLGIDGNYRQCVGPRLAGKGKYFLDYEINPLINHFPVPTLERFERGGLKLYSEWPVLFVALLLGASRSAASSSGMSGEWVVGVVHTDRRRSVGISVVEHPGTPLPHCLFALWG